MDEKITENSWPRHITKSVDTRKNDLVIRISNWLNDKHEPGYDVEVYNKGIYDWNLSESFTLSSGLTKQQAKSKAIDFAKKTIEKLL